MADADAHRDHIRAEIERLGPPDAYRSLIAENDALVRGVELDNGREIAAARTAIHSGLMAHWAEEQHANLGYDRPFSVVALGGTGRGEMTPCSDTDFAFLFDDEIDGNPFLLDLQGQLIHSGAFRKRCGFGCAVLPFNFDDIAGLDDKTINASLDMRPVYDPDALAGRFRERIRASYDPFQHFLHVSRFWRDHWGESNAKPERIDAFDIKNDGLRVFLAGVWSQAGGEFRHSHEIYQEIEDPRALEAYGFLLRLRAFVHLQRGSQSKPSAIGNHAEDVLRFEDYSAFGDLLGDAVDDRERFEFANEVRGRLLASRRRVERYTWGVIGGILRGGRPIRRGSAIVYGTGGLRDTAEHRQDARAKSRAALAVLLAAQRHDVPINPSEMEGTFRDAGDWLEPVPELAQLFYEPRGSLAKSLEVLAGLPGACERLFPGYAAFESSIDERVMQEKKLLRGALVRQKIAALERDVAKGNAMLEEARNPEELTDTHTGVSIPVEAALLEPDQLAAVKLALQTKRLPETPGDLAVRDDKSLPLHRRFTTGFSGIALSEYYERCFGECGFSSETLELARFLIEKRRLFKTCAEDGPNSQGKVDGVIDACQEDEMRLRALFVFTCADRTDWESEQQEPARWFTIRELYEKAVARFRPDFNPRRQLIAAGFAPDQLPILEDFGRSLFGGGYRQYARRYGSHLLHLAEDEADVPPRVEKIFIGSAAVLAVVTRDHPGIAASISGTLWRHGVGLSQAHLFSAKKYGLALDFFHIAPTGGEAIGRADDLPAAVRDAIVGRKYISAEDEATLPDIAENITLEPTTSGNYHLRAETAEDVGGLIYFLACKAHRSLLGNIYALAAHSDPTHAWVSLYLGLPEGMTLEEGREIVGEW